VIVAIVQARMGSTRLPGKVLAPVCGKPMLERQLERVRRSRMVERLVVATSEGPEDDAVAEAARGAGCDSYRGSLEDVLDRFTAAARHYEATDVVRLTADCPLSDPELVDDVLRVHLASGADYSSNVLEPRYPDGLDVEVLRADALERAWREAVAPHDREHVTPYLLHHPERFLLRSVQGGEDLSRLRWTVDHPEDLAFVRAVFERLLPEDPSFGWREVLELLEREPRLAAANAHLARPRRPLVAREMIGPERVGGGEGES